MAKQKKKRNKAYKGADAAVSRPNIVRVSAVKRSRLSQWWLDNKKRVKPIAITTIVVVILVWLISQLFRFIFN